MREMGKQAHNKQVKEGEGAHGTTQRKKESRRLKDSRNGDKGEQTKLQQPAQNDGETFGFVGPGS